MEIYMCLKLSGRLFSKVSCHFHLVLFYQLLPLIYTSADMVK